MAFPKGGLRKQITYLILFPIIFPLWLTLPDTRSPPCKCLFYKTPLTNHYFFLLFLSLILTPNSALSCPVLSCPKPKSNQNKTIQIHPSPRLALLLVLRKRSQKPHLLTWAGLELSASASLMSLSCPLSCLYGLPCRTLGKNQVR